MCHLRPYTEVQKGNAKIARVVIICKLNMFRIKKGWIYHTFYLCLSHV